MMAKPKAKHRDAKALKEHLQKIRQAKKRMDALIEAVGIIPLIVRINRERNLMMMQRISAENRLGAYLRREEGWSRELPEKEQKAIKKRVEKMLKDGVPEDHRYFRAIDAVRIMSAPCVALEEQLTWELEYVAKQLPAWQRWGQNIVGLGAVALGVIVGEAGDLSRYSHEDKLKSRLGLAPHNGKSFSRWRREGGLTKDEWTKAGYSPKRLGRIYAVLLPLFRNQSEWQEKVLKDGTVRPYRPALEPYGVEYYKRRAKTALTHPEWAGYESHGDGLRIMIQKVVTDLWSEWRRADVRAQEAADGRLPASTSHTNGSGEKPGRRARVNAPERAKHPLPAAMELA